MNQTKDHKAGFVNIIGRPNVGKSTLLNALMGEKLAITSSKAQTTRHRMFGILNDPDYQIVFSDTPGAIDPAYKLQEKMMDPSRGMPKTKKGTGRRLSADERKKAKKDREKLLRQKRRDKKRKK